MKRTETETVAVRFTREEIEDFLREKAKVPKEALVHFDLDYKAAHDALVLGAVVAWSHVVG